MTYDKHSVVPVLEVEEGFDKTAKKYKDYWSLLDSVDNNKFLRLLPRSLQGLKILDLGCGDGRVFSQLKNSAFEEYIALDASQKMLDRFTSSAVNKIHTDIEDGGIPLEDDSIDLVLIFFLIEYIYDLPEFFVELSRVIKPGSSCVMSYFHQRNPFVFGHGEASYKIKRFPHNYKVVEKAIEYSFLSFEKLPVTQEGKTLGYIYELRKS